jgi:16S rRNA (uracil1498-N3)-methyltransferase
MPSTAADRTAADRTAAEPAAGDGAAVGRRAARRRDSRLPVFLSDPGALAADQVVLDGPEGRHAATVRRIAVGERVDLTDGAGLVVECVVRAARAGALELGVLARRSEPRPAPALVVAQALPKGDHGTLAVDLMTEGGVDVIVPWAARRCVTRWEGQRGDRALARWRAAAREAAKQSRRAWLPEVTGQVTTGELARRVAAAELAVMLDPDGPVALSELTFPGSGDILVIVGPEGGVSPEEAADLARAGAVAVRLGPTVLRASTAGLVACAVIASRSGRWN